MQTFLLFSFMDEQAKWLFCESHKLTDGFKRTWEVRNLLTAIDNGVKFSPEVLELVRQKDFLGAIARSQGVLLPLKRKTSYLAPIFSYDDRFLGRLPAPLYQIGQPILLDDYCFGSENNFLDPGVIVGVNFTQTREPVSFDYSVFSWKSSFSFDTDYFEFLEQEEIVVDPDRDFLPLPTLPKFRIGEPVITTENRQEFVIVGLRITFTETIFNILRNPHKKPSWEYLLSYWDYQEGREGEGDIYGMCGEDEIEKVNLES